jgi:hypothetical protein
MNNYNQTDLSNRDINSINPINLNKSEKFQDAVSNMRLMIWNKFLMGVASNPQMTKKEICHHLDLTFSELHTFTGNGKSLKKISENFHSYPVIFNLMFFQQFQYSNLILL